MKRMTTLSFGPIDALCDVSLALRAGEGLGLPGDTGAGKSTVIKFLSDLHKPTSGVLEMDGLPASLARPSALPARATPRMRASPRCTSSAAPSR